MATGAAFRRNPRQMPPNRFLELGGAADFSASAAQRWALLTLDPVSPGCLPVALVPYMSGHKAGHKGRPESQKYEHVRTKGPMSKPIHVLDCPSAAPRPLRSFSTLEPKRPKALRRSACFGERKVHKLPASLCFPRKVAQITQNKSQPKWKSALASGKVDSKLRSLAQS